MALLNIEVLHARYSDASRKASEILRQLGFAGIAIVWFFGGGEVTGGGEINVNPALLVPGAFIIVALLFDFLQAAYNTALWGIMGWYFEQRKQQRTDIDYPGKLLWPPVVFMWAKLVCIGVAYVLLAIHFLKVADF
jgi:hypothetical protein